jgi:hypothetical protein
MTPANSRGNARWLQRGVRPQDVLSLCPAKNGKLELSIGKKASITLTPVDVRCLMDGLAASQSMSLTFRRRRALANPGVWFLATHLKLAAMPQPRSIYEKLIRAK